MGGYQLHRHELSIAIVLLLVLLALRINKGVDTWRKAAKNAAVDQYKDVHTEEMLKKWVTTQYCKADKTILCPEEEDAPTTISCYTAFDPPVRFVLDLTAASKEEDTIEKHCSIRKLIEHTHWSDKASAKELEKDELITYFVAHLLDQVRIKSADYFRADDGSILEYEQSRLIESTLASILHLFTSPIQVSKEDGKTISTIATEYEITEKVWTREEILSMYHEAVLWHTQHKRHGHASAGAALRLSRQQPSFLFKFLPLVTEQIQNLELDSTMDSKYQRLYPFLPKLGSSPTISLDSANPQFDQCLWSHYEEHILITEDCALALETAPLKMRDLDWEGSGNYALLLVYIYNCFSSVFALWMLSRAWSKPDKRKTSGYAASAAAQEEETEVLAISNRSLKALSNRSLKATSSRALTSSSNVDAEDVGERKSDQIRRVKCISLSYLGLTIVIALVSSCTSEKLQLSDFWDGILCVVVAYVCLHPVSLGVLKQSTTAEVGDKRLQLLLDPTQNKHYKKFASIEFEAC